MDPRLHADARRRATPGYLTVFVTILAALILAACCSSAHGACAAFFWCIAGLGAAFGLDFAMDAGNRSHTWNA
jgi:hypothetical protein